MSGSSIDVAYDAPPQVRVALNRIGRTEDVRFSPNNRRLALAGFGRNVVGIVDVDITMCDDRPQVGVTNVAEFSSPYLSSPHGVDFLDDETIIVTNRGANATVFRLLPAGGMELTAIDPLPGCEFELLREPSALTISTNADGTSEVLICNNSSHTVTRHALHDDPLSVTSSEVLLDRWLDLPDAVAVSADGRWLAISNHDAYTVVLYHRSSSLDEDSDPDGILLGALYPHGLRFTADARHLFVADSSKPGVLIYARNGQTWRGVQHPAALLRVMDDDAFGRGRDQENGGPKGIDIDRQGHVLAATFENQPLAFFNVPAMLERSTSTCPDQALRLRYELEVMEQRRARTERRAAKLIASRSFRITKPLRRINSTWSRMWR